MWKKPPPEKPYASMNTFIRAVETWLPSRDGSILEFGTGIYGSSRQFEAISRQLCFGRGEGLPGQAWEAGHPVMLKDFNQSNFRRTTAAQSAGITCGIAVPVFDGTVLNAVLVIFCGDGVDMAGAIELWRAEPAVSPDMTRVDGHYGNTGDTFEFISRSTIFRRGTGLPGMAWQAQAPVFLADLGRGSGFLRHDSALKVGINRGLAWPCPTVDGSVHVLALLSALDTPIARRLEIWSVDASQQQLQLTDGFCELDGELGGPGRTAHSSYAAAGDNPMAQALTERRPVIRRTPPDAPLSGPTDGPMVAFPILAAGSLTAIVALYL
jgi:hypothetical protein